MFEVGAEESLLLGPGKENEWLILKRPVLPDGFQVRVWGEGSKMNDFLLIGCWWGNSVVFQESQSPVFWFRPVCCLSSWSPSSTWVGAFVPAGELKHSFRLLLHPLQRNSRTFVLSLQYCFLAAFPFFLPSLTTLISNGLSLLFETQVRLGD